MKSETGLKMPDKELQENIRLMQEIGELQYRGAKGASKYRCWFTVETINGSVPNLLRCLKKFNLTPDEVKLLDQEYPLKEAEEILDRLGFDNYFVFIHPEGCDELIWNG